jgi:hypothetical protein
MWSASRWISLHGSSVRLGLVPRARDRTVTRSRAPVLVKIDLRWSWIVCSDSDIRRAMARVSAQVLATKGAYAGQAPAGLFPEHRGQGVPGGGQRPGITGRISTIPRTGHVFAICSASSRSATSISASANAFLSPR